MTRGNGNNNRGRGRGRGGRGAPPFRGSPGRGAFSPGGRGGRGGRPVYRDLDVIDVDIQRYADEVPGDAYSTPRARGRGFGRGRGRGRGTPINLQVFNNNGSRMPPPPRREGGSGTATPASRGSGRGSSRGLGANYNENMPLSKLIALDRPYLRPINFVPAQATPVLFQNEEEILEVHEFIEPEDHVPTAEQVSRVFSHRQPAPPPQDSFFQNPEVDFLAEDNSEDIMTVDFGSLGQLMDNGSSSRTESKPQLGSDKPKIEPSTVPQTIVVEEDTESVATIDFGSISQLIETNSVAEPTSGPINTVEAATPVLGSGLNILDVIKEALAQKEPENLESSPSIKIQSPPRGPEQIFVASDEVHIQIDEPITDEAEMQQEDQPLFVIDPNPTLPTPTQEKIVYNTATGDAQPLGVDTTEDDEVIVYVAPHPRSSHPTPSIPTATLGPESPRYPTAVPLPASGGGTPSTTTSDLPRRVPFSVIESVEPIASSSTASAPPQPFAGMSFSFDALSRAAEMNREQAASPRARRLTKRDRQARFGQWNGKKRSTFGGFGAMLEERHLHEDDGRERREGSDIDWGDSDDVGAEIDRVSSSLGGMDIDPDLDPYAMQSFANSMSVKGMEHTRIDDIEDAEKLRLEDEDDDGSSSGSESGDSELDAVLDAEEQFLVGEGLASDSDSDSDSDEDDEENDVTPTRNFQARLKRIRQNAEAKGKMRGSVFTDAQASPGGLFAARAAKLPKKGKGRAVDLDSDDDSDDFDVDFTWADKDEEFLDDIQDLLDENEDMLSDRKQRKLMFKAVHNGDFSVTPAKKKRDYGKNLPEELRAQWESDRAKKAENKRKRAAARLEAASDPFGAHKGGKKGHKAILKASRLAAEADVEAPRNAGPNLAMIVDQMRAFLANMNLTVPMSLAPMDKAARAKVHEIADSFGLKSVSKGKGSARYTTIVKTSRSGTFVNERKITRILKSGGNWGFTRPENPGYGSGGKGRGSAAPKHREGDEVGKAAPKIGESNIGFQMLANMGWAEGDRIGVTGGLEVPLTAIIKNTKLGLGATR